MIRCECWVSCKHLVFLGIVPYLYVSNFSEGIVLECEEWKTNWPNLISSIFPTSGRRDCRSIRCWRSTSISLTRVSSIVKNPLSEIKQEYFLCNQKRKKWKNRSDASWTSLTGYFQGKNTTWLASTFQMVSNLFTLLDANFCADSPILVHVHGGYWQVKEISHSNQGFLASVFHKNSIKLATVGYELCPEVSLQKIMQEVEVAIRRILNYAKSNRSRYLLPRLLNKAFLTPSGSFQRSVFIGPFSGRPFGGRLILRIHPNPFQRRTKPYQGCFSVLRVVRLGATNQHNY